MIGGVTPCTRSDVLGLLPLIWLHEGTTKREPWSHVDTYLDEFNRMSQMHGEALVGDGNIDLPKIVSAWHDSAMVYSKRMTDTLHNPLDGKLNCEFNYTYPPGSHN